jgi:hypothetical protein
MPSAVRPGIAVRGSNNVGLIDSQVRISHGHLKVAAQKSGGD